MCPSAIKLLAVIRIYFPSNTVELYFCVLYGPTYLLKRLTRKQTCDHVGYANMVLVRDLLGETHVRNRNVLGLT